MVSLKINLVEYKLSFTSDFRFYNTAKNSIPYLIDRKNCSRRKFKSKSLDLEDALSKRRWRKESPNNGRREMKFTIYSFWFCGGNR